MSNRVWQKRRSKKGLAARQFKACQRQLRRLRTAKAPLPHVATSRSMGLVLTVTISDPAPRGPAMTHYWEDEISEFDMDEVW